MYFSYFYLDYSIIYSKDVITHLRHVEQILTVLRYSGVSIKLRKLEFFSRSVNYLGIPIRPGLLEVAEKVVSRLQRKEERSKTQVRSFFGL